MSRNLLHRRMQDIERSAERRLVTITSERLAELAGCSVAELERGAEELERRFERAGARTHQEKLALLAADNGLSLDEAKRTWLELLEEIA